MPTLRSFGRPQASATAFASAVHSTTGLAGRLLSLRAVGGGWKAGFVYVLAVEVDRGSAVPALIYQSTTFTHRHDLLPELLVELHAAS